MILVILLGLIFPFPLANYCLLLATINRRPHPVMIWGLWDFAGVLFAASGFIICGGPAVLAGFNQRYRDYLLTSTPRLPPHVVDAAWYWWLMIWFGYFTIVVAMTAYMLWRRRLATAVYNIELNPFLECFGRVLDRLDIEWLRSANRVFLRVKQNLDPPAENGRFLIDFDTFPAMRHITIYWPGECAQLRQEIEHGLALELAAVRTHRNPASLWLWSAATMLLTIMFFAGLFIGFVLYDLSQH